MLCMRCMLRLNCLTLDTRVLRQPGWYVSLLGLLKAVCGGNIQQAQSEVFGIYFV